MGGSGCGKFCPLGMFPGIKCDKLSPLFGQTQPLWHTKATRHNWNIFCIFTSILIISFWNIGRWGLCPYCFRSFLPTNDPEHLFSLLNRRTKNGVQSCQYCSESLLMKVFSCSISSLYDNMTKLTDKNNEYCGQWCFLWPTIPLQDPIDCLTNHKQEETSWGFILFNV